MIRFKHLFGLLFCGTLVFFGYNLYVFGPLSKVDAEFEINTHFKNNDLNDWLSPQRANQLVSRWRENRTTNVPQSAVKPAVLNQCILTEKPCVEMLEEIAPARAFWKTEADIFSEKNSVKSELAKALASKKLKNRFGKTITTKEQLMSALKEEQTFIEQGMQQIPWYYRPACRFYNFWNYTPIVFFTFLHYSHLIAALPEWIKDKLNALASWYMESKYKQIKEDTKKIVKQKTWRIFHRIVESRVEKTFNALQSKAEKQSYIHDYSPYYRKLRYDFDLEIKNIYNELERLLERNLALQEIAQD